MLALLLILQAFCIPQRPPPNQHSPPNPAWNREFLSTAVPLIQDASGDVTRCRSDNDWGLSYDDGPGPYTPILLDALQKHNLKATFFVVGSKVLENPEMLRRTYAAGHQIGIHTWSHPPLNTMSNEQIVAEIMNTATLIKETIGVMPKFIRPPYGAIDARVRGVIKRLGLTPVLWSRDTNDNTNPNVVDLIKTWVGQKEGQLTLQHDLLESTAKQAADSLQVILDAGFSPKTVAACIGSGNLYGDIVGVRPPPPTPNPGQANPGSGTPARTNTVPSPQPTHVTQNSTIPPLNATEIQGPMSSEGNSTILGLIANSTLPFDHLTNATVYKPPTASSGANGSGLNLMIFVGISILFL